MPIRFDGHKGAGSLGAAGELRGYGTAPLDIVCFSHLRWDLVYQRPQHLLMRAARGNRVSVIEEPMFGAEMPHLKEELLDDGLMRVIPQLPEGTPLREQQLLLRRLVDSYLQEHGIRRFIAWYYTPLALRFAGHLRPELTVYDCMDDLGSFLGADRELPLLERSLLARSDVVFTGGYSLYRARRHEHANIHAFPSSIDAEHFASARARGTIEPVDQAGIPGPRFGFFGVIDERLDMELLAGVAEARPDWQFIMIGPVVKIDPATLPRLPNIHWLGRKDYAELPDYVAHWDVALMPFALNAATRFISPTKTLEYLAAGKQVVSTPITDVVTPYGKAGLVRIATGAGEFTAACQAALEAGPDAAWLAAVDSALKATSWDATWEQMAEQLEAALTRTQPEVPGSLDV